MRVRELRVVYAPTPILADGRTALTPSTAGALLRERLAHETVEVVVVLLLNTKHRLLGVHELGRGTLDSCIVHPRDVFKVAILANASGVIVGHNHPSGDPTPSPDDVALCTRLRSAATILGIELLDFIIVGNPSVYSFKEQGR